WIVSYADMLTLLFALFVVLYAISDTNPKKLAVVRTSLNKAFNVGVLSGTDGASPIFDSGGGLTPSIDEIKSHDLAGITHNLGEFAKLNGLDNRIQIRQDAKSITISLADNLLFDSGSATLKPGSQDVLSEVASVLRTLPNQLRVEGHTDNVPVNNADFASNWELSATRATTVLRFLAESGGLPGARMHLAGFADTQPLADNATPEGRALNRRADIVVVYPTLEELQKALGGEQVRP
ncbi:MAG: flagellar motor protein MotB, partial [Dehalococcoidia bacterium]|nr:flagellar motor protein MotB [Dehalococcoidia bacterium]